MAGVKILKRCTTRGPHLTWAEGVLVGKELPTAVMFVGATSERNDGAKSQYVELQLYNE